MSTIELWSEAKREVANATFLGTTYGFTRVPPVERVQAILNSVRAANSALQSLERLLVGVIPPKEG